MKVYHAYPEDFRCGECDGVIVVAENAHAARQLCEGCFSPNQGYIHIKEVGMDTEKVVMKRYFNG